MFATFRVALAAFLSPPVDQPTVTQFAALCHRPAKTGGKKQGREVLLVSSSRGRWILPKGWPIAGKNPADAALQEAWEEGGVRRGKVNATALGAFDGEKRYDSGATVPCHTEVYSVSVTAMSKNYPEADRRNRIWVAPEKAAEMVDDDGLRGILRQFQASASAR